MPGVICIPGRLANGEDSEWFMTDGTSQVSIGKGSRCPKMTPEDWAATTHEVAKRSWRCYFGGATPCGHCKECIERGHAVTQWGTR